VAPGVHLVADLAAIFAGAAPGVNIPTLVVPEAATAATAAPTPPAALFAVAPLVGANSALTVIGLAVLVIPFAVSIAVAGFEARTPLGHLVATSAAPTPAPTLAAPVAFAVAARA